MEIGLDLEVSLVLGVGVHLGKHGADPVVNDIWDMTVDVVIMIVT